MRKFLLLFFTGIISCMLLWIGNAVAQTTETRFYDTVTKVSHEGRIYSGIADGPYMYLAGASFSETLPIPTLTKVDTSGTVIWTATTHDNNEHFYGGSSPSCKSTFKSGNRIYTIAEGDYWSPAPRIEIWCISDSSGEVLWRSSFNHKGLKIVDYSPTELLLLTGETNGVDSLRYNLLNKTTGEVIFYKSLGVPDYLFYQNKPDIFVDDHQNILISINDTCKKFRDKYLTQLQWNSSIHPSGFLKMVDKILQDSARYILLGNSYARAVDSATGTTIWYRDVPVGQMLPFQTGNTGRPKEAFIKDSLLYITWVSPTVGSINLRRGFTLTRINTQLGTIRFNVAYDFTGIPQDPAVPAEEDLDWPMAMAMDSSKNIYLTGSYDYGSGPENPSNWGIMKINGITGANIYESTITLDSTQRLRSSQGRFLNYYNGKMYCAGNAQKNHNTLYTSPLVVSFDTISVYHEQFRVSPDYGYRYSSSLIGLTVFSNQKMALLKKLGQSSVIELRDINNQLVWSRSFSSNGKYVVPQNFKNLADTSIAASFIIYTKDAINPVMQGLQDSIFFVRIDSTGTIAFERKLKINSNDTTVAYQIYSDKAGKTNFVYLHKGSANTFFDNNGFMLNGAATGMGIFGYSEIRNFRDIPKIRITRFQHYNGDSLVFYHSDEIGMPSRNTGFLYSATQSAAGTYAYYGTKLIRDFTRIYSVLKLDSASFFITGKSETGTIIGARFNRTLANSWVWSRISPYAGNMFNADTSASSIYCVSEKTGNILYLSKLNKITGGQAWDFERTPQPYKSTTTLDLKYNNIAQTFTVGGYISDSASESPRNTYFYITLDSSGNIIKDITRTGIGVGETRINTLEALQNGTNAYGGSLATSDLGTVGFYNADCASNITPSVSISTPSTTICVGSAVTFTATAVNGGTAPVYQWQVNGINAGTNSPVFTSSTLNNGDQVRCLLTSNASCVSTTNATSNIITVTIIASVVPSVNINTPVLTICSGSLVTLTATPVNAGPTPSYQWQVNGINAGTNTNVFTTATLNNNDQVKVILTSSLGCASPSTVTSNVITMTVIPMPFANAGNDTIICSGTSAQLQASGGSTYSWSPAGGLSNPTIANPIATPLVTTRYYLTVSNGPGCSAVDSVLVTVNLSASASVSINTPNTNICSGTSVTFNATANGTGSNPVYQWQVNGINAGTNSNTFTTTTLNNNDQVKVILTSSLPCVSPQTATSNIITMSVTPAPVANAGNDNSMCAGASVQLQGSGGMIYSWAPAGGLSNPNIANPIASPLITTVYILTVSNGGTCTSKDTVVITVNPLVTPTVNISTPNTNICSGTAITFTATPINGGSSPVYQWKVNGVNAGGNSNTFTSSSLLNNDQVKLVLTSSLACVLNSTATSNTITMSVEQLAIPIVSLNNRVFTVTNPDAAATYTWQIFTNGTWTNVIPSATGISYTAPAAGEYRVKAVKGPCTVYSASQVTNIVSPNSQFIYLHPNPANQMITLDSINLSKRYETVEITDMQAKRVLPLINIKNQIAVSIDISLLSDGTYLAIIRQKDGTYTAIKFVKQ